MFPECPDCVAGGFRMKVWDENGNILWNYVNGEPVEDEE